MINDSRYVYHLLAQKALGILAGLASIMGMRISHMLLSQFFLHYFVMVVTAHK